jgi:hypothetical protein
MKRMYNYALAAFAAVAMVGAPTYADGGKPQNEVKPQGQVKPQEQATQGLPRLIIIRVKEEVQPSQGQTQQMEPSVVADGYTVDFKKQIVDAATADEAIKACEDQRVEPMQISENSLDNAQPAMVGQLIDVMGNVADESMEEGWARNRWGFSVGAGRNGFFFGYGHRGHFGYNRAYPSWRHASYGYHWNSRLYPYYPYSYRHYRSPYSYYYYYNPYRH